ncbi:MAG: hypothetical protein ACFFD4_01720 [Candidatus Odinarchaeota archaeon]
MRWFLEIEKLFTATERDEMLQKTATLTAFFPWLHVLFRTRWTRWTRSKLNGFFKGDKSRTRLYFLFFLEMVLVSQPAFLQFSMHFLEPAYFAPSDNVALNASINPVLAGSRKLENERQEIKSTILITYFVLNPGISGIRKQTLHENEQII